MIMPRQIKIGLAGNPNAGKTSIFNALTGSRQKTGNYAGVTVDKKEGRLIYRDVEFTIVDLPGTYSLTAYSQDEVIARDFIIDGKPDLIIDVLDATNLERNLNLCLQFQELGLPVVGALNVVDQAAGRGIVIDDVLLGKLARHPHGTYVGSRGKMSPPCSMRRLHCSMGNMTKRGFFLMARKLSGKLRAWCPRWLIQNIRRAGWRSSCLRTTDMPGKKLRRFPTVMLL